MTKSIDYGHLMHDAMRGLIQNVLNQVAAEGLPGQHHFFIKFDTMHPEVEIADWLSDRYPEEMTIVIQNWFEDLNVTDEGFAITLNFGDSPEPLYIPFDAVRTFVDPSVEFGLKFEAQEDDEGFETSTVPDMPAPETKSAKSSNDERKEADVVSLDSFRKT